VRTQLDDADHCKKLSVLTVKIEVDLHDWSMRGGDQRLEDLS
jgi:hypothetical protein